MDDFTELSRELASMVLREENLAREVSICREHVKRITRVLMERYPAVMQRIATAARRSPPRREPATQPAAVVSQREYARLRGVGEKIVHGAVRRGELTEPAVVGDKARIDVAVADRQLAFTSRKISPRLALAARLALEASSTQILEQMADPIVDYASIVDGLKHTTELPPSYVDMTAEELAAEPETQKETAEEKRKLWLKAAGKVTPAPEVSPEIPEESGLVRLARPPAEQEVQPAARPTEPVKTDANYAENYSDPIPDAEQVADFAPSNEVEELDTTMLAGGANGATDPDVPAPEQPDDPQPPVVPDLPPGKWEAPVELPPPEPSPPVSTPQMAPWEPDTPRPDQGEHNGRMVPRISTKRRETQEATPLELPPPVKVSALGRAPILDTSRVFDNHAIDAKRAKEFLIHEGFQVIPAGRNTYKIDNRGPFGEQEMIDKAVGIMERNERMAEARKRQKSAGGVGI
jgi:hypothetical protein